MVLKVNDKVEQLYNYVHLGYADSTTTGKLTFPYIRISTSNQVDEDDDDYDYKDLRYPVPDVVIIHGDVKNVINTSNVTILGNVGEARTRKLYLDGKITTGIFHLPESYSDDVKVCDAAEYEYHQAIKSLKKGNLYHIGKHDEVQMWSEYLSRDKLVYHLYPDDEKENIEVIGNALHDEMPYFIVEGNVDLAIVHRADLYVKGDIKECCSRSLNIVVRSKSAEDDGEPENERFYKLYHQLVKERGTTVTELETYLQHHML